MQSRGKLLLIELKTNKVRHPHAQKVKERVCREVECSLLIQLFCEPQGSPSCSKASPAPVVSLQGFWGSPGLVEGSHAPRHRFIINQESHFKEQSKNRKTFKEKQKDGLY